MNVAAIFNLYKSINPPVLKARTAMVMRRVAPPLPAAEEERALIAVQSGPDLDAIEIATRLAGLGS